MAHGRRRTRIAPHSRIPAHLALVLSAIVALWGCDRAPESPATVAPPGAPSALQADSPPDEPSPRFRNVDSLTSYVGDAACSTCHAAEASAYRQHAMARSFHRWTPATRVETTLDTPLQHLPTGFSYSVVDVGHRLYQVEFLVGPQGKRLHELRRRIDYVMGSGQVARTYFTEENGRLFQLPLTWYREHGWDFSPGYEINNARFDRLMPDRCIACHSNYPRPIPHLEGKYAELPPGIGCERCHGPGALHVAQRRAGVKRDSAYDNTIVNPARLPLERRLDSCEQCHVHTAVAVLRDGKDAFSYLPSQLLRDQWAYFKVKGSIDVVSHADRLRQSACFVASRSTARPLECATCHDPHLPPPTRQALNQPCQGCHAPAVLDRRLARSASAPDHTPTADCVSCHMPRIQERTVPHGTFTEHWIRRDARQPATPASRSYVDGPIDPFFERDRSGPEAPVYQGMGRIVFATLANDGRAMGDAAAALSLALGNDSTRGNAHFLLGVAQQQLGRTDDAIRSLERSVRIDSTRPDPLRALAQAYERAGRAPATIDQLYRRALALQPALAWIRAEHADFLQAQGRLGEATREYRRALDEQPGLAVAWFNLGTVLAEERRLAESSDAFREAVHLDPSLAEALSPLLEVRTAGSVVVAVRRLGSPLPSLPMRDRGSHAVQWAPAAGTAPAVEFLNVPPGAQVRILKPDGTLVRALPAAQGSAPRWNLLTQTGTPIAGGLYRAHVQQRDARGRPLAPRVIPLGIVRAGRPS